MMSFVVNICNICIYTSSIMPSAWCDRSMGHIALWPSPPSLSPPIHGGSWRPAWISEFVDFSHGCPASVWIAVTWRDALHGMFFLFQRGPWSDVPFMIRVSLLRALCAISASLTHWGLEITSFAHNEGEYIGFTPSIHPSVPHPVSAL